MGYGQKIVALILVTVVLAPPMAAFYGYFSGKPLQWPSSRSGESEHDTPTSSAGPGISLVSGQARTLEVPDEVAATLGIRKGEQDQVAVARLPANFKPLVLPGSTALDPTHLARIRARFAPARVVAIAQVADWSGASGRTQLRELRQGDRISKGDVLGVFYSVDVASKKNDLLDALVQLELDQAILDRVEANRQAVPEVYYLNELRAVQADRNGINRSLNNLKLWDIPQEEIDTLHAEARKISADKGAWFKTPEGRWAKGEDLAAGGKLDAEPKKENPWGKVTLRAPFEGVVVERNVHVDEMVVDNTVNLFQIADVSRLLVIASCPEDGLPALEALKGKQRRWTVRTVGAASAEGLPGTIDEIGYVIDPNQHTAVIKGYVENPHQQIRAGQFVSATVNIPPPEDVVEIPADAVVDDGLQALVFVQPDAAKRRFTMRRVHVTHRFDRTVFVRATPIPADERLTAREADEGLLSKEALHPGDRVLVAGAVELKAALLDLESRPAAQPTELIARAKARPPLGLEPRTEVKQKARKG
jgi:cobalt-zinc-cadmium efflux system membrane fusion protein